MNVELTDDQIDLLALFAISDGPEMLGMLVVVLSPPSEATWRRPDRKSVV